MNRGSDMPRLVNFSDSDMSTDTDSDEDGKPMKTYLTPSGFLKQPSEPSLSDHSDDIQVTGKIMESTDYKNEGKEKESESKHKDESGQKFGETSGQTKSNRLVKHNEGGTSRDRRSGSRSRRSRSYERRSRSRSGRSDSRDKRSSSRGRRSGSRGRRSSSRGRRSSSRGRRSASRDRSRSRGRKSGSRGRSESRSRRSRTRSRSRSKSRDRRRRSHSNSRSRYRRSRSRSKGKYRSGSRRRKDRRHGSPRRSRRNSPPRAHRTLDTLEKLGIELRPAATEEAQPSIPPYYNRLSVNPNKYAQQIAKRKLLWGSKTSEEGTAKASNWQGATFSQDQDGKMTAKFKRLMGIKEDGTSAATPEENKGQDLIKRQQELFSSMEIQYEAARQATHTQRGVGLGFSSHPHHYPS